MVRPRLSGWLSWVVLFLSATAGAQQKGGIRGVVYDKDFEVPLAAAQVTIVETGETVACTDEGNFVFAQVDPGPYTVVFSKEGYTRQVRTDVVVGPGRMTELEASLSGEFTDMEEFIVQDVQLGTGNEAALLDLRMQSPALMDSISADLMSRAGASDAAGALRLVAGATIQEGKFAVIRGLPDRYVNSQMNGVRLPTADADKRAVQLDQFPSAAIESIQVTKTFTPDQQGDASGGAVNVILKGIPAETIFNLGGSTSFNTQVAGRDDFLTYKGGGLSYWGKDKRNILSGDGPLAGFDASLDGAVGTSTSDAPMDYKWSTALGGRHDLDNGVRVGGFGSLFYERDSSFHDDGVDDKYWVRKPGDSMTPQWGGDNSPPEDWDPENPSGDSFETSLFDVTRSSQQVRWGDLGVLGLETENHLLQLLYMSTRVAEDTATLAEDTRGKFYYFPDYDRYDPTHPGNTQNGRAAAPFLRNETLTYTERTTETLQVRGRHTLPDLDLGIENIITFRRPEIDWTVASSSAELYEYKRQFASTWQAEGVHSVFPFITFPEIYQQLKPAENINLGNLQIVEKDILEQSDQYSVNLKLPFEQWSGDEGYVKLGLFHDQVTRRYNQDTYGNFTDTVRGLNVNPTWEASWEEFWSQVYPNQSHTILDGPPFVDVDYEGKQKISAWYYMVDVPLDSSFNLIGGFRHEDTELSITNQPEADVTWIPPGATGPVKLNPGDADVFFEQSDALPSIGFVYKPWDAITFRGSYSETVARQTFKELTPIQQQEFLGADVFIGNPELTMSSLKNYDLRLDYTPYEGGLVSLSYFRKKIYDPIEYVQGNAGFSYTTAMNYPEGRLRGWEVEVRQDLGRLWNRLTGVSLGANATFIDSEVRLPAEEAAAFEQPNIRAPMPKRDMTNAPEHLYNIFLTYEPGPGTQLGLFYTVRGDTLVAGAGQSEGKFIPNVYETAYGTLNLSLSHRLNETWKLRLQAKNLLDPQIETVYRSEYLDGDRTKGSYRKGIEFSISLSAEF